MAGKDTQDEIEELRAKVAELTAERKAKEKEKARSAHEPVSSKESKPANSTAKGHAKSRSTKNASGSSKHADDHAEPAEIDLASQFQELLDTLHEEIREASPVTVLVVFALGVLVGRVLPK